MFNGLSMAHRLFTESYAEMHQQSYTKLGQVLNSVKLLGWFLFLGVYLVVASCFAVVGTAFVPPMKVKELHQ